MKHYVLYTLLYLDHNIVCVMIFRRINNQYDIKAEFVFF